MKLTLLSVVVILTFLISFSTQSYVKKNHFYTTIEQGSVYHQKVKTGKTLYLEGLVEQNAGLIIEGQSMDGLKIVDSFSGTETVIEGPSNSQNTQMISHYTPEQISQICSQQQQQPCKIYFEITIGDNEESRNFLFSYSSRKQVDGVEYMGPFYYMEDDIYVLNRKFDTDYTHEKSVALFTLFLYKSEKKTIVIESPNCQISLGLETQKQESEHAFPQPNTKDFAQDKLSLDYSDMCEGMVSCFYRATVYMKCAQESGKLNFQILADGKGERESVLNF